MTGLPVVASLGCRSYLRGKDSGLCPGCMSGCYCRCVTCLSVGCKPVEAFFKEFVSSPAEVSQASSTKEK